MKVSASISDFPVFSRLERSFREFKQAGVDGVELVVGVKSRWQAQKLAKISQKYNLPVTSIHQPGWSLLGIYRDDRFVRLADTLGVRHIVYHPLCLYTLRSKRMMKYFTALAKLQKQYGFEICLENMQTANHRTHFDYWLYKNNDTTELQSISDIAEEFGFKVNYDTSHIKLMDPTKNAIFQTIFPKIGNIHLSSFTANNVHLPLYLGDFAIKEFITYLVRKQYNGLLTLEVFYPKPFSFRAFDFSAIAKSVALVKEIADRS